MDTTLLFNINGLIGSGAYEIPQFPTAESFVKHLDYLGIDRSLVSHIDARNLNPTWGNKRLLKEIAESGYSDRLIPAFAVTPLCYYEKGTLDFLKNSFCSGKVKAIRIFPALSRFPILRLERIFSELVQWEPVVFWDCVGSDFDNDVRDFCTLAQKFPTMSFVFTQRPWTDFGNLIDAMWRQKNTYVDTSLIHMRDTVPLLVTEFGAERVLFGIGRKSHYGAAIAALAYYPISQKQRKLIAHGNVERLLKLEPLKNKVASQSELLAKKTLWKSCRNGLPVKGVKVIDAHGHTNPTPMGTYIRETDFYEHTKIMIGHMDRLGITKMIISSSSALFGHPVEGNRFMENALKKYSSRFSGYLVFNPIYKDEMTLELDNFFKSGFFIGFKILASYWNIPVTDVGYEPVWKYADKYGLPILLHTWGDSYNSPEMLKDIVKKYSNAIFLLGHSGGDKRLQAEELTLSNPNVFLEFCGSFTIPRPFEESMRIVGNDKVVWGSDTGAHDQAWELGRYLSMPIPDNELIPGLGNNFAKILKNRKM